MKKLLFTLLIAVFAFNQIIAQQAIYDVTAGNGNGLRFWSGDYYKIHMGNTSEYHYGPVTDYSIKMNMNSTAGRGWTWGQSGIAPIAAMSNTGAMQIAGNFTSMANGIFNGNVGIGTTTPSSKLEVFKYMGSDDGYESLLTLVGKRSASNYQHPMISFGTKRGTNATHFLGAITSFYQAGGDGGLQFLTKNGSLNPVMSIDKDGMLTVLKGVHTEEVIVDKNAVPDYVFEPNYNLKPLNEVDQFIKENQHLPNIPSAEEFKENGVGLGEMDDMLLRKVEELTLYVIEQNENNEQLKKAFLELNEKLEVRSSKLEALEKENEVLKTRLGKLEAEK